MLFTIIIVFYLCLFDQQINQVFFNTTRLGKVILQSAVPSALNFKKPVSPILM